MYQLRIMFLEVDRGLTQYRKNKVFISCECKIKKQSYKSIHKV